VRWAGIENCGEGAFSIKTFWGLAKRKAMKEMVKGCDL
jgi:hypothetical protein